MPLYKCCDDCPGDSSCPENKWCVCGSEVDSHGIGSGHSPVGMHDYYCRAVDEKNCTGHVASAEDPKVCGKCGVHIDELRPDGPDRLENS